MNDSRTRFLRQLRNPGELEKFVYRLYTLSRLYAPDLEAGLGGNNCYRPESLEISTDRSLVRDLEAYTLTPYDAAFLLGCNIKPW